MQMGAIVLMRNFNNADDLNAQLDTLVQVYGAELEEARQPLLALYEQVFNHKAFTGRSGGMFGFEGLGCIYWHMVSKLLLAVQENFFAALTQGADDRHLPSPGQSSTTAFARGSDLTRPRRNTGPSRQTPILTPPNTPVRSSQA